MNKKLLLVIFIGFLVFLKAEAQNKTVTGTITDSESGQAIPGVNVFIKGTSIGTATDSNGNYSIEVSGSDVIIVFSGVGLSTKEIVVGGQSILNVGLVADTKQLEDVVITAYGEQEREKVTGAISTVDGEQIKNLPILGIEQALQGRASGVQITQNSGTPGGSISVRVRGASSISGSNEPLYVIDGVPILAGSLSNIDVGNQQPNALSNINPGDIESIEVLKDAASASLYGSRAANGVVLITTKRGRSGKTKFNFGYYYGQQDTWNRIKPTTGPQYIQTLADAMVGRYGIGTRNCW
jgi:TonB-dependent starch-binding outer membrane protein SusC